MTSFQFDRTYWSISVVVFVFYTLRWAISFDQRHLEASQEQMCTVPCSVCTVSLMWSSLLFNWSLRIHRSQKTTIRQQPFIFIYFFNDSLFIEHISVFHFTFNNLFFQLVQKAQLGAQSHSFLYLKREVITRESSDVIAYSKSKCQAQFRFNWFFVELKQNYISHWYTICNLTLKAIAQRFLSSHFKYNKRAATCIKINQYGRNRFLWFGKKKLFFPSPYK